MSVNLLKASRESSIQVSWSVAFDVAHVARGELRAKGLGRVGGGLLPECARCAV